MTTIPGPYEQTPPEARQRIQANIPEHIHEFIFMEVLPRRGTQDKVIGLFIDWFHNKLLDIDLADNSLDRERQVLKILEPIINKK